MAETKIVAVPNEGATAPQEVKKLKRLFLFQNHEYDLNDLTPEQKEYLRQFPNEVPFLK